MEINENIIAEFQAYQRCLSWYLMPALGGAGYALFPNGYKISLTEKDLIIEKIAGPAEKRTTQNIPLEKIKSVSTHMLSTSDYLDIALKSGEVLKFKAIVFKKQDKEAYKKFRDSFK